MNLSASPSDEAVARPGSPGGAAGDGVNEGPSSQRNGAMKFLYPTGSRPLDGYTIKRGVGRGGFGEVYFATSDAGKEVAIKLIRRNLDVELRGVTHCLNLKHPNLISLYDIREDDAGDQWVIMEYVAGDSLEQSIDRSPEGMDEADVQRWFREMCAGVAYLHDHGIVHRDLKPANVFLDGYSGADGVVKIGDYGLAKFISCSRRSGQTESVGTVHYMAPEIANGRYGREVDTYALGVILYEMLTGRVPFEGESMGEVIMKHLTAEPDLAAVPMPFREAVQRTLAKDPELRVGSVRELLALLPGGATQTVNHSPIPAPDGLGDSRHFSNTEVRGYRGEPQNSDDDLPYVREPLFQAASESWQRLIDGWYRWDVNPAFKGMLLFFAVALAVLFSPIWVYLIPTVGVVYVAYYIFWSIFVEPGLRSHRQRQREAVRVPKDPEKATAAPAVVHRARRVKTLKPSEWIPVAHQRLRNTPTREKLSGWVLSLLGSAVVCSLLSLVVPLFAGDMSTVNREALHLWFSVVTTMGAWCVITVNRFGEGRFEDQVPLRTLMLASGLLVGIVAYGMSSVLLIGVPLEGDFCVSPSDTVLRQLIAVPASDSVGASHPGLAYTDFATSLIYFALLFVAIRWYRMGEYVRESRFSLWRMSVVVVGAWLLHLVCWYPQPTGLLVAAIVAASVQLCSPWLRPSERKQLAEVTV